MRTSRIRLADVLRLLVTWFLAFVTLPLTAVLLPGFGYTSWLPLLAALLAWVSSAGTAESFAASLLDPDGPILGGDELHQHLIGILESLGHRASLQRSTR